LSEPLYNADFYVKNVDRHYTVTNVSKSDLEIYEDLISEGRGLFIDTPKTRTFFAPGEVSHIFATKID